jgi:hypothetical protein
MTTIEIETSFKKKVCDEVQLEVEGNDRLIVYTPFTFDDGDHFVVVLKRESGEWLLSDEGHTFMHMSYTGLDFSKGTRAKIIDDAIASFGLNNRNGELVVPVSTGNYGDALFSFVQALGRITSTTLWTKEIVASTFEDDLNTVISEAVPMAKLHSEYVDSEIDANGHYVVPYKIDTPVKPCFLFGIDSDLSCKEAIITCAHFERSGRKFHSVAVFEDQTEINRRSVAQLSDIIGKSFASLGAKDRLKAYLDELMTSASNN